MNLSLTLKSFAALAAATVIGGFSSISAAAPERAGGSAPKGSVPMAQQAPSAASGQFARRSAPYGIVGRKAARHQAPAKAAADLPATESKMFAAYQESSFGYFDYGMYGLSMTAPAQATLVENIMDMNLEDCAGAVYADGKFFYAEASQVSGYVFRMTYHLYDASTWQEISSNSNGDTSFLAQDMTYDPVSGKVFGFFVKKVGNESHSVFGELDIRNGAVTDIADHGSFAMRAVSATDDGRLFGIGADGGLYRIDKSNGQLTLVGNTGLHSDYLTTGAIDALSGKFYYYLCNDADLALYTVDLATALSEKVYDFSDYSTSLAGLYIIAPAAAPKAPAAVQNLQLEFNDASLSGFVKFTTPYTLFDDSGATGDIRYSVSLNGEEVLSGETSYGVRMALPLSVEAAGEYTVSVKVSNEVGDSPVTTTTRWIGPAVPAPLTDVRLSYAGGVMSLSWGEPTALAGDNFDPAAVTYTVVRFPDAVTVAEGISTREFSENIAIPAALTEYYYEVTADFRGALSAAVASNRIALGDIVPPFADSFDVPSTLNKYTVVDANGDGLTWEWIDRDGNGALSTYFNGSKPMDDWLFLPAAKLKKDVNYQLVFDVCVLATNSRHNEKMEVCLGVNATPEAMTSTIIPVTEFRNTAPEAVKEFFSVEADGMYYIGFHVCSDRDMYRLYLDNLSISAPITTAVPDAVSNVKVTPAADGSLKAELSFTAPVKDIDGNALATLSGVKVFRGDDLIGEVAVNVGEHASFTDENAQEGVNTWRLVPYNDGGDGRETVVEKYVGVAAPSAVSGLIGVVGSDEGMVDLSWNAVAADVNGFALTPAMVSYDVYRIVDGAYQQVADGLKLPRFSHRACAADAVQEFAYYIVKARTSAGESAGVMSNMIAVGAPYEARFAESFAGGGANSIWYNMAPAYPMNGSWVGTTADVTAGYGMTPYDGDNGMLLFGGPFIGCEAYIFSGKIKLTDIEKPMLTFRYFDDGSGNILDVVVVPDMLNILPLKSFVLNTADEEKQGWKKGIVDLSAYKGKTIQLGFRGEVVTAIATGLDDVRIVSDVDYNLAAVAIAAPATVKPASEFAISVSLLNTGRNQAEGYTVDLFRDGKLIATRSGEPVDADAKVAVMFTDELSPASAAEVKYHAIVNFAADGDAADNTTADATVKVMHNSYPAITDLTGNHSGNGELLLSWSEPDPTGASIAVTEDVEALTPFSIGLASSELGAEDNVGDWTMIDGDGSITYGIDANASDDDWVRFPNTRKEMAFQVFNGELAGVRGWDAYSGKQMFACFAATVAPNNDWLISPELNGQAQKVSFMARSISMQYPESFEFLYSTTGKSVADFKSLGSVASVPAAWTEYAYNLPEGARYFAIRCNSYDAFALLVDYITYVGLKSGEELSIVGYNIYRNGVLLNNEPIMEPEFTDGDVKRGDSYRVTVVYNLGESAPSNEFIASETGIDNVAALGGIRVEVSKGEIAVAGAAGSVAELFAIDGRKVASALCADRTVIRTQSGVYLLRIGADTFKVRVP